MDIIIKNGNTPIYEQIYQQLKTQIMNGSFNADDELPSIRNLSKSLNISVITVKKAYELLVTDHLAYSVPGKGFYVSKVDLAFKQEEMTKEIEEKLEILEDLATAYDLSLKKIFERRFKND